MPTQLRSVPPVPAASPADYFRPGPSAGSRVSASGQRSDTDQLRRPLTSRWHPRGWPVLRTRRELDALRGEMRELQYMQDSLLSTVDRLIEATAIILDGHTADGQAERT
jgi:hypothetical protein